jgi:nicotinate-nucleotide adenylyltransferase
LDFVSPPPGRPKEGSLAPGGKARSAKGAHLRRVGLFGGTFDPPQLAHMALARGARDALQLDELRWVPTGQPWQKSHPVTPGAQRAEMVALAIAGEPGFALERCEVERAGPSYTLQTVRDLQQRDGPAQWVLVIGADQYNNLHTWHGWRELLSRVTLAVAERPGVPLQPDPEVARFAHHVVPLKPMAISATDIRARVQRGESLSGLVADSVASYIDQYHLYRSAAGH